MKFKVQMAEEKPKAITFLLIFAFLLVAALVDCGKKGVTIVEHFNTYYGFVMDSVTAAPIQNAELLTNSQLSDSTDSTGFYLFGSLGSTKTIVCQAAGYQTKSKTVTVPPGSDSIRVDFELAP